MANKVKEMWAANKAVVNGWLAIPSAFSAEMYAQCGWDSVTVDMQHGVQDYQSCVACFQGMQPHNVTPMVRVPWLEPGIIGKVLDGGAATILQRKLEANVSVLTSTVWTIVIPAALIYFAYLTWRPNRFMQRVIDAHSSFRPFGVSAILLGVLAWLLNDSGVSMPAMMLMSAVPYTAWLALDLRRSP